MNEPTKKIRCHVCNKKCNLDPIICKCKNILCMKHRFFDSHNCSFDYSLESANKLQIENPQIRGNKIIKI